MLIATPVMGMPPVMPLAELKDTPAEDDSPRSIEDSPVRGFNLNDPEPDSTTASTLSAPLWPDSTLGDGDSCVSRNSFSTLGSTLQTPGTLESARVGPAAVRNGPLYVPSEAGAVP